MALLAVSVLAVGGCKGKLPKALTSASSKTIASTTKISGPIVPGMPAHDFAGEIVFGKNPLVGLKKGDVIVVTYQTSFSTPPYFFHNKLYPRVRWVQLVTEERMAKVMEETKQLARTEVTDGLTIIQRPPKQARQWPPNSLGTFHIVQDGIVVDTCTERDVDHAVLRVLEGKAETAARAKQLLKMDAAWADYEKRWIPVDRRRFAGKTTFPQFVQEAAAALKGVDGPMQRQLFITTFLSVSGCKAYGSLAPFLKSLRPDDLVANSLALDIKDHMTHSECRDRVLQEMKLIRKDPSLANDSGTCLTYAKYSRQLGRTEDTRFFLDKMIAADELKPRYAKLLRERYQAEYDLLKR